MTSSATILEPEAPLLELLDQQFSSQSLILRHGPAAKATAAHLQGALHSPLSDFLARPAKEFRARLVELCWCLSGGHGPVPDKLGSVLEVLHAGSLIVDDIEDESATRRGRPALHVSYGLPVALNAGNWLYFWAYSLVEDLGLGPHVELSLYRCINRTLAACHEGQALDLTVRMGRLSRSDVAGVVRMTTRLKTGALMGLAALVPAVAAGAPQHIAEGFQRFGESLGVGLQMLDDLGGLTSERRCHKGHEDLIHGRPTWPWAWLAEELPEIGYHWLQQKAREVEARDLHPEVLAEEMRAALGPDAKDRVHQHLVHTLRLLPREIPGAHGVSDLQHEITRLVGSYD